MRTLILFAAIANALLFAAWWRDWHPWTGNPREPERLERQHQTERLRLMPAEAPQAQPPSSPSTLPPQAQPPSSPSTSALTQPPSDSAAPADSDPASASVSAPTPSSGSSKPDQTGVPESTAPATSDAPATNPAAPPSILAPPAEPQPTPAPSQAPTPTDMGRSSTVEAGSAPESTPAGLAAGDQPQTGTPAAIPSAQSRP
jgi:hypothetical protein